MKNERQYSIEEVAKYNTIEFSTALKLIGIVPSDAKISRYYDLILKDIKDGAIERHCQEFDNVVMSVKN